MEGAHVLAATRPSPYGATVEPKRPFASFNDLKQGDLLRRPAETVAALLAGPRLGQPALRRKVQDLGVYLAGRAISAATSLILRSPPPP
jgi:hypothetical protein